LRAAKAALWQAGVETEAMRPEALEAAREVRTLVTRHVREPAPAAWPPLQGAASLIGEDLCLLQEAGEQYRLTAASLCFPTDWQLREKLGLPLLGIHAPIAGYAEKLGAGVAHFFRTVEAGLIFTRANWFVLETDAPRYLPQGPAEARYSHVTAANAGETLFVRCERQTLRRLPETRAILFTIGITVAPLHSLEPALARDLASAVERLPAHEANRRETHVYVRQLRAYAEALPQ
jgi:dimethylamine monooxygenase subunit A